MGGTVHGFRGAGAESLMQDITYKYAKRGSMAAAVSWKWVLLVLAERRMDDTANVTSEA